MAPRQIKGRAWRVRTSPRPYAGEQPSPTQQYITVPTPIITENLPFYKGACVCIYAVWGQNPAPLSVCLDGKAQRGPGYFHIIFSCMNLSPIFDQQIF